MFSDDYVLASGLHPHFKLKWLQLLTKYDWKLLDNVNMTEKRVKHKIVQEVKILARQMATPDPSSEDTCRRQAGLLFIALCQ